MWRRTFLVFLCLATVALADDQNTTAANPILPKSKNAPKEGTYYSYGQAGVKELDVQGTTINVTFKPTDEQFHWCPGINVEKVTVENSTQKVLVVTFVRCKTSQDCGVDKQARIGKRLIRTVSFDTLGLDVYVRAGSKFRRIHKSPIADPPPKQAKKTSRKKKKSKTKKKKSLNRTRSLTLYPSKTHGAKGRVKNFHIQQAN